jgi:SRSO17 transposase
LEDHLSSISEATASDSCALRLRQHLLGSLLCQERLTVSNLICSSGDQHRDWSAHYRLYSRDRVDENVLFARVLECVLASLPAQAPLVTALDDTLVRKRGTQIHGVSWKRDPLGPAFQTNLVRGQRYLQFSAAWPLANGATRMVPIAFHHAPSAAKPAKGAGQAALKSYREAQKQQCLNAHALKHMRELRQQVPQERHIILNGDGSYTNATVLKGLPAGCTYLGRMRKDAVLHCPPGPKAPSATGRRPSYGELAPTPEALRQDEATAWQSVHAFAAGKQHEFRIKTLGPVLWRKAGANLPLRIVVIAPLGYRLRKGSKLLYRQPAYLLCTDPELPLDELLQDYLGRWGIEVNFREEKTLIGTGQAQVRGAAANQHFPATTVAAYALLWAATLQLHQSGQSLEVLRPPKWRRRSPTDEASVPSTGELLRLLRYEYWAAALRPGTFYHFVTSQPTITKPQKQPPDLPACLFAAA